MVFCQVCGNRVAPDDHFCMACGKPVNTDVSSNLSVPAATANRELPQPTVFPPPTPNVAMPPSMEISPTPSSTVLPQVSAHVLYETRTTGNAITWPFYQKNWFASLWMPLLWWFPLPIFPIGIFASFGWLIDAVGRRGRRESELLPRSRNLGRMCKDGFIFLVMNIAYFAIPLAIFAAFFQWNLHQIIMDFAKWLWDYFYSLVIRFINIFSFIGQPPFYEDFWTFCLRETEKYIAFWLAPVVYLCVAIPLFVAASICFALTGKASSYFKLFYNLRVIVMHLPHFLWFLLLLSGLNFVVTWACATPLFAVTLVGPVLGLAVWVWITAYLAGNLAAKIYESETIAETA